MTKPHILITGASGLIGTALTNYFISQKYPVSHLGRTRYGLKGVQEYVWDISSSTIEPGALEQADIIIHLAGANLGKGSWTSARKKEIKESRTGGTRLLIQQIQARCTSLQKLIAVSGVGYYGNGPEDGLYVETDRQGSDFMAEVCQGWENETQKVNPVPWIIFRLGMVLSADGGVLEKLITPVRYMIGSSIGSGKQRLPWIHITDLCCAMGMAVLSKEMHGIYNLVSPEITTQAHLMKTIAKEMKKPFLPVGVPSFIIRMMLGDQADLVLSDTGVSAEKIQQAGFEFSYTHLESAIADLLKNASCKIT